MTENTTQSEETSEDPSIAEFYALIKKNKNKEVKSDYSGIPTHRTRPTWPERVIDKILRQE